MPGEIRELLLPDLGEGLVEAEVVQWLVAPGDHVTLDQNLLEVETAKAVVAIPSPWAGEVVELLWKPGDVVPVGRPLLTMRVSVERGQAPAANEGETPKMLMGVGLKEEAPSRRKREVQAGPPVSIEKPAGGMPPAQAGVAPSQAGAAPAPRAGGPVLASPPVRRLAADLGVDLAAVAGSGPRGNITRQDVEAAAAARAGERGGPAAPEVGEPAASVAEPPAGGTEERIPVRSIRRVMAEKMTRSHSEIADVAEFLTIDGTELVRLRQHLLATEEEQGVRVTPLAIVVKALVATLPAFPLMNSSWAEDGTEIIVKHYYHVGVATDTERGLVVPVVRNADRLSIFGLAREIGRLVSATRDGRIGPSDLVGSTITVTNLGSFGVDTGTPIINYPEAAIVALGTIAPRAMVVGEEVQARQSLTLSCCFDHRIIDGATAGRFLRRLGDMLESPALLLGTLEAPSGVPRRDLRRT